MAVAVFNSDNIVGEVEAISHADGIRLIAHFTKLPKGKHGFHIHKAGDLRGEGCHGLCEHFDVGTHNHGAGPESLFERHTGDLGNIEIYPGEKWVEIHYFLKNISVNDLWGRSIIIHADEDDLGMGKFKDSKITGHSGARIGCAIFGRVLCQDKNKKNKLKRKTRKQK